MRDRVCWEKEVTLPPCSFISESAICSFAFPGGSVVKNLPTNVGHSGSIPGLGRSPEEGNGNPFLAWETQVFLPGKSHGQRSLAGYRPCSQRVGYEWETEHIHTVCAFKRSFYTLYSCLECFFPFLSPLHLPNPLETQLKCHFPLLLSLLG